MNKHFHKQTIFVFILLKISEHGYARNKLKLLTTGVHDWRVTMNSPFYFQLVYMNHSRIITWKTRTLPTTAFHPTRFLNPLLFALVGPPAVAMKKYPGKKKKKKNFRQDTFIVEKNIGTYYWVHVSECKTIVGSF